nr:hypothetical protein [Entomoplasma sp. MP1]
MKDYKIYVRFLLWWRNWKFYWRSIYASVSRKFDAALKRVQNLRKEEQLDIESSINEMQKELLKIDLMLKMMYKVFINQLKP